MRRAVQSRTENEFPRDVIFEIIVKTDAEEKRARCRIVEKNVKT